MVAIQPEDGAVLLRHPSTGTSLSAREPAAEFSPVHHKHEGGKRKRQSEWKELNRVREQEGERERMQKLSLPDRNLLSGSVSDGRDKVHHALVMMNRGK